MTLNRVLRYAVLTGLFVIPFVPLLIANTMFFPFITGKNFFFRIVVELIFAAWLILALRDPAYRPKFSWTAILFALFVVIMAVADAFSVAPSKSFWSNYERMEGFITLAHLFAFFLVAGATLSTGRLWKNYLNTSLFVSALVALYGVFQLAGVLVINQGGVRLDATLGNASYLGIYMLFHIFIALYLMVREERKWLFWAYAALASLEACILYYTATRGAILGFLGGILVAGVLIAIFEKSRPRLRRAAVISVAVVLLLVGGFFAVRNTSFIKENPVLGRLATITLSGGQTRLAIWNMGWQGFTESPKTMLIGWGQESFNHVFNKYYDPKLWSQEQWFDRVHNIVFDWLVAGGALGLLAYLLLFFSPLYYMWRRGSSFGVAEKALLTGLLAGYLFHNLFVFDNIVSYILFVTILAYVHAREGKPGKLARLEPMTGNAAMVISPIIGVAMLLGLYYLNVPSLLAGNDILKALQPQSGGASVNLQYFQKALSRGGFGNQEIREQLVQAAANAAGSADKEIAAQYGNLAATEMDIQIKESPNDARFSLFMGTLLDSYGQFDQALTYLNRALELSPNKQMIMFEIGLNRLNAGKTADALTIFKRAYDLDPSYSLAVTFYAAALYYSGEDALADQVVQSRYGTLIVNDDRLLKVYFDRGKYDRVEEIVKLRITQAPNSAQLYVSLAAVYLKENKRAAAIEALEKAITLDATFKEQGEYFIREIQAGRDPS